MKLLSFESFWRPYSAFVRHIWGPDFEFPEMALIMFDLEPVLTFYLQFPFSYRYPASVFEIWVSSGKFCFWSLWYSLTYLESYKVNLRIFRAILLGNMVFQSLVLKNFEMYSFRNIEIYDLFIPVCTNIDFSLACLTNCNTVTLRKGSRQKFTWNYREERYI